MDDERADGLRMDRWTCGATERERTKTKTRREGRRGHCIFAAPQVGMQLPTKNERHPPVRSALRSRYARARHTEDGQMGHSFELTFLSSAEAATEEKRTVPIGDTYAFDHDYPPDLSPPGT